MSMMDFQTWDDVVSYVYWLQGQIPPTDGETYEREKERIKAEHIKRGYSTPSQETNEK